MAIPEKQQRPTKREFLYTEQQYLDYERTSEERHEYQDGEIIAMANEKVPHGHITVNLVIILGNQLYGTPCAPFIKDTRIRSGPTFKLGESRKGRYSYPDVVVVCGDPEYLDEHEDTILNPKVIFEVLSPSTEAFDRGDKCTRYQTWNDSLADYILVSQTTPLVEHFTRSDDGIWVLHRYAGMESGFAIPSIRCTIQLADLYRRVVF